MDLAFGIPKVGSISIGRDQGDGSSNHWAIESGGLMSEECKDGHRWCFYEKSRDGMFCRRRGCNAKKSRDEAETMLNAADEAYEKLRHAPNTNNHEWETWRLNWCDAYAKARASPVRGET